MLSALTLKCLTDGISFLRKETGILVTKCPFTTFGVFDLPRLLCLFYFGVLRAHHHAIQPLRNFSLPTLRKPIVTQITTLVAIRAQTEYKGLPVTTAHHGGTRR